MFLSNTATTAMMMPIANAILEEMRKNRKPNGENDAVEVGDGVAPESPSAAADCQPLASVQRASVDDRDRNSIMMEDIPALRSKRCTHSMLADGCTIHGGGHNRKRDAISVSSILTYSWVVIHCFTPVINALAGWQKIL